MHRELRQNPSRSPPFPPCPPPYPAPHLHVHVGHAHVGQVQDDGDVAARVARSIARRHRGVQQVAAVAFELVQLPRPRAVLARLRIMDQA
eukprot:363810-Chlamydomonas_euryale.AAC.7